MGAIWVTVIFSRSMQETISLGSNPFLDDDGTGPPVLGELDDLRADVEKRHHDEQSVGR